MIASIIIMLIIALIVIAVVVSALQQHKEKQEQARRRELAKQRKIVEETEEALINSGEIPISAMTLKILHRRVFNAYKAMLDLSPSSKAIASRCKEAKERAENPPEQLPQSSFALPDQDKQLVLLIQGIKKLRAILRNEQNKGAIDASTFIKEDKHFERLQLQINIESLYKRAIAAKKAGMIGSARQYFEKAYTTLNNLSQQDEYSIGKLQQIKDQLADISEQLKSNHQSDIKKRQEEESDELDVLFAPKKKW